MAKSRGGSRKGGATKRSKTTRSVTRRRSAKKAAAVARPKGVELRGVREKLRSHVATLSSVEQPSDKVRDAIDRLNRCLAEMDEICGPHMLIPLD